MAATFQGGAVTLTAAAASVASLQARLARSLVARVKLLGSELRIALGGQKAPQAPSGTKPTTALQAGRAPTDLGGEEETPNLKGEIDL